MRYVRIYILFIKASFMQLMAHRFNLFMSAVANIVWTLGQVISLKYIFDNVQDFEGWDFKDLVLLLTMGQIFVYAYYVIYEVNLREFPDKLIQGDLDRILTKPVNTKFIISFEKFSVAQLFPTFTTLVPLFIYSAGSLENFKIYNLVFAIFVQTLGLIIFYFLSLALSSFNFIFEDARSLKNLLYEGGIDMNRVPLDILPKLAQGLLTFVLPIAYVSFYPTKILRGEYNLLWIILSEIALFIAVFLFSKLIWSYGIRKYSGVG